MTENNMENPEIQQDHQKGPGWFLILSYIVISIISILYFFFHRDWKSEYDIQQEEIQQQIEKIEKTNKK